MPTSPPRRALLSRPPRQAGVRRPGGRALALLCLLLTLTASAATRSMLCHRGGGVAVSACCCEAMQHGDGALEASEPTGDSDDGGQQLITDRCCDTFTTAPERAPGLTSSGTSSLAAPCAVVAVLEPLPAPLFSGSRARDAEVRASGPPLVIELRTLLI